MCSCDQSLVTLAFLCEKLSQPQFYKDLTRKNHFFEGWCWFKFNNLGQALGTNLKFPISVANGLKLKVRKFLGSSYRGKTSRGAFCHPRSWIRLSVFIQSMKSELSWNLFTLTFEVFRRSFWLFCEVNKTRFTLLFNRIYGLRWKTWVCLESFE